MEYKLGLYEYIGHEMCGNPLKYTKVNVVAIEDDTAACEVLSDSWKHGHGCDGLVKDGKGWWINICNLRFLGSTTIPNVTVSFASELDTTLNRASGRCTWTHNVESYNIVPFINPIISDLSKTVDSIINPTGIATTKSTSSICEIEYDDEPDSDYYYWDYDDDCWRCRGCHCRWDSEDGCDHDFGCENVDE